MRQVLIKEHQVMWSAVYRWHVDYAEWDRLFKDDAGHDCLCRR